MNKRKGECLFDDWSGTEMKTEDEKEGRNEKKRSWETAGRSLFMASQRFKASHARRGGIRRGDCCTEFWRFFMVSFIMSRYVVLRCLNAHEAGLLCLGELTGDVIFGITLSVDFSVIELATGLLHSFLSEERHGQCDGMM